VLINENSKLASNFPLLEILNVVEFTFFTAGSFLSCGFLPINNGPKSKIFSLIMNALETYESGAVGGLDFLQFQKMFLGRLLMLGKSLFPSTVRVVFLAKNDSKVSF